MSCSVPYLFVSPSSVYSGGSYWLGSLNYLVCKEKGLWWSVAWIVFCLRSVFLFLLMIGELNIGSWTVVALFSFLLGAIFSCTSDAILLSATFSFLSLFY